jgi:DNA-binding transcriptional MocR family regulator
MAAFHRAVEQLPGYLAGAGYHPAGLPELREAVASSYAARGLPTDADQIVITPGALAAITIGARALVRSGARVLLESPTYPNAIATFARSGARTFGVDVGATWASDVSAAVRQLRPAAVYLIPDFHNPTGALRSDQDRRHVADALRRSGTTAVIDESLVGLNLDNGPMPAPFASYHPDTLTAGSLSKTFWGGLRVGWLRVPTARMDEIVSVRLSMDLGSPVLEQLAATQLLDDHQLLGQRVRQLRSSRDAAMAALAQYLPDWSVQRPSGGLCLWCTLPEALSSALAARCEERDVLLAAGPRFAPEGGLDRFVRIPYTQPAEVLTHAIARLGDAWRETLAEPVNLRRARNGRGATALVT